MGNNKTVFISFQDDRTFREENPEQFTIFNDEQRNSTNLQEDHAGKTKESVKTVHKSSVDKASKKTENESEASQNDQIWKSEFECPVCLEEMSPPMRIHQCAEGHLVCEHCKSNSSITCCPTCRGNFMGRAIAMEKLARLLFKHEA